MSTLLFAPTGYWCLTDAGRTAFCNGCGARGKLDLIPDNLLGLDISECCNIHDYMYATADNTIEAKDSADRTFLNNMLRLICNKGGFLAPLRRKRAYVYYLAVHKFGGPAFWEGKNKIEEGGFA